MNDVARNQIRRIDAELEEGWRLMDPSAPGTPEAGARVGLDAVLQAGQRSAARATRLRGSREKADSAFNTQLSSGPLLTRLFALHQSAERRLGARSRSLKRAIRLTRMRLFFVEHGLKLAVAAMVLALAWAAWRYGPDALTWMERKSDELRRSLAVPVQEIVAPPGAVGGAGSGATGAPAGEAGASAQP